MASGVKVADQVLNIFKEMRLVKTDADTMERIRLVVLQIENGFIDVEVGKIYKEKDLQDKEDVYAFFLSLMKDKECRYLLYDCHYETDVSPKEELVFVMWAPESAKIGNKMNYASSKGNLMRALTGVKHVLEVHCPSDYAEKNEFAKRIGNNVVKIEGHTCIHDALMQAHGHKH